MSSAGGRISAWAPGPSSSVTRSPSPRTSATGMLASLPLTRSAADASSSAMAVTVTSSVCPKVSGLAAVVAQRGQPGGADGRVRLAYPPGPSHRVGDHHRHVDVPPLAQPAADPARGVVRVRGQQGHRAGGRVGVVHPGRGEHQAVVGLHDAGRAAPRHHPDRLRVDRLVPVGPDDAVLRLAHDLRGDHQDVAVGQVRRGVRDQAGQVVAGRDLGEAGHAGHRQAARGGRAARAVAGHPRRSRARSRAARAMVAVAARLVMYRGSARTVIPARSGSSTAALSCSSTSQPFSSPGP